ncbi:MAG: aminotransferase class I/II-fold pyridoxal phosphate-dependent enzyme [Candidatus Obscuribacterales bacterium]|nr:aminotransferase class I/II-fold pyridoxal phosphate-dependent enzyme [Candidatus Obscuribacterales bacterium]
MKSTTAPKTNAARILPRASVLSVGAYDAPAEGRIGAIRLDFNESTKAIEGVAPEGLPNEVVCAYPEYSKLIQRLARKFGLDESCIVLTNGSDEGISLVANTFIEYGEDQAIVSNPCFFMIRQCLALAGAKVIDVPVLEDLRFDVKGIVSQLEKSPKIAMFASPDNPTGSVIEPSEIEDWCRTYEDTLFVIDEAYGEYNGTSVVSLVAKYSNLVVLKTFSKAWGLAGLRIGVLLGSPLLTQYINRVKLPYSVNAAAVSSALNLLDKEDQVLQNVASQLQQRARTARFLSDSGYLVKETNANWCLFGAGMLAAELTNFARSRNVLLRNRSNSRFNKVADEAPATSFSPMWGWVRVSAGGKEEMSVFESVIREFRNDYALIFDLDGTLVDTSASFDETVAYLVQRFSGKALQPGELTNLRLEGGFNDDWVASRELLARRGCSVPLAEVAAEGERYYLSIAAKVETLLIDMATLQALKKRHPMFIVTGRSRREYAPVWGERLDPIFEQVYCVDDVAGLLPKPAPDYLLQVLADYGIKNGAYIGNSVDDMRASRAAGLTAIGVTDGIGRDAMVVNGAECLLNSCQELDELLMIPKSRDC